MWISCQNVALQFGMPATVFARVTADTNWKFAIRANVVAAKYTRTISGRPISILFCYLIFQLSNSTIRLFHLIFVLIFLYLISSSTLLLISIVWPQSSSPSNLHLKIVFSTFSASFSSIPSSPQMQYLLMLYKNSI